jgi:quinohemoprotein ethanol dehydrogenase
MARLAHTISILVLLLAFAASADVDGERIANSDGALEAENWLAHGRGYAEQRYSPLDEIDRENANELGLAWSFDVDSKVGLQSTPLVIDGTMYVTAGWSVVHALDAKSGAHLWTYDPEVSRETSYRYCCGFVNRGVAAWGDKLYLGALDGRLISIDAKTGGQVWSMLTVPPPESGKSYAISGAPRIVKGKVIIGNAGAEFAGTRGYVSAYDAESGELLWRFFTVPGNPADGFETPQMEEAAKTWTGEWWKLGGGGTVWDSMAYDPELDLLYIGVGNGTPHNQQFRSPGGGDNLFLCSVIALRPDTGEYVWHYQQIPGETWDYTATQHMVLADLEWEGEQRQVLMQAPKAGFFYILDRATGELLSAEPYARLVTWATHYDMTTGRPVEVAGQRFEDGPALLAPLGLGAHNWHPMSYSPRTGLMYIPAQDVRALMEPASSYTPDNRNFSTGMITDSKTHNAQLTQTMLRKVMRGYLLAWNPKTQTSEWEVERPGLSNSGTLATAGDLVFQGTVDGDFQARDAYNGSLQWEFAAQNGMIGSPISYAVDGEQYIAIPAARGGGLSQVTGVQWAFDRRPTSGRVLAFKLGGRAQLPKQAPVRTIPDPPPIPDVGPDVLAQGRMLYANRCDRCHGSSAVSDGSITDLRHLPPARYELFEAVVLDGALEGAGMPRFPDLDAEGVAAIRAFVIEQSHQDVERRTNTGLWRKVKQKAYDALAWLVF